MKVLIKAGWQTNILVDGTEGVLEFLQRAKLITVNGYEEKRVFSPSESTFELELIPDTVLDDDRPVLKAMKEAQKEAQEERNKRYTAENKLEKLQKQFGLSEEK